MDINNIGDITALRLLHVHQQRSYAETSWTTFLPTWSSDSPMVWAPHT